MIYCPYTDKDLSESEVNTEHILPLSLGGIDELSIPVCKQENSRLGSIIDGKLANDFLVLMDRNRYDIRGRSTSRPVFYSKNAIDSETGLPLQFKFDRHSGLGMRFPIRNHVGKMPTGKQFEFKTTLDVDIRLRFAAKIALSAGYFVYGELFRNHVKHEEIRTIMNFRPTEIGEKVYDIETRVDDIFNEPESDQLKAFRMICRMTGGSSCIGLVPGKKSLAVFVGVLGQYVGMINAPADTKKFPNSDDYNWGHFLCVQDNELKRLSIAKVLRKFVDAVEERKKAQKSKNEGTEG